MICERSTNLEELLESNTIATKQQLKAACLLVRYPVFQQITSKENCKASVDIFCFGILNTCISCLETLPVIRD